LFLFKLDQLFFNSIETLGHPSPIELLFVAVEVYCQNSNDKTKYCDPDRFQYDPDYSSCGCHRVVVTEANSGNGRKGPPETIFGVSEGCRRVRYFNGDDEEPKDDRHEDEDDNCDDKTMAL